MRLKNDHNIIFATKNENKNKANLIFKKMKKFKNYRNIIKTYIAFLEIIMKSYFSKRKYHSHKIVF